MRRRSRRRWAQPILPPFLSRGRDPTLPKLGDTELVGFYQYDDEGVRRSRVPVVKNGVLDEFLMSRSPLARFPRSNGHGRGQPGLRPSLAAVEPASSSRRPACRFRSWWSG